MLDRLTMWLVIGGAALSVIALSCLGLWWAAESWEARIRKDERQKVVSSLDAEWSRKLRSAELDAKETLESVFTEYNDAIEGILRQRDDALERLRKRPSRVTIKTKPADHPTPVEACTAVQLAREDAEFLEREAAAAAVQQEQLIEATQAYETCRRTLRNVSSGQTEEGNWNGDQERAPPGVPGA